MIKAALNWWHDHKATKAHDAEVREAEELCDRLRAERVADNDKANTEFKKKLAVSPLLVARMQELAEGSTAKGAELPRPEYSCTPYVPPGPYKNKVCSDLHVASTIAKDAAWGAGGLQGGNVYGGGGTWGFTGLGFPGFPYLSELTEITEYRDLSCRVAAEMCRKWIEFRTEGGTKKRDKEIRLIKAELKRLKAREYFLEAAEKDGFFGRCQIFMDLGQTEGPELAYPVLLNQYSVRRDSLRALKVIEPITTYPAMYNSSWPLKQDYYVPSSWWVYGQQVSSTRLLTFVSRPLPDLLKPVFNFSGMSLSQLGEPYVNYWLNTRNSVGRLLTNFSCSVLKTNMEGVLQGENQDNFLGRAQLYNAMRDNQGLMLLDKDTEEFEKHETSLAGLDKLQAQAQEHMASVAKTPLVIMFGITPQGLNASDEQGLRIFYDYVADQQERMFRSNLERLIRVIQLSKFGEIYEDITFDFVPLMSMTEKERALIHKSDAEEAQVYCTIGAVSNEEVRAKIAADPDSGWSNLDVANPTEPTGIEPPAGAAPKGGAGGGDPKAQAENVAEENSAFNTGGDQ